MFLLLILIFIIIVWGCIWYKYTKPKKILGIYVMGGLGNLLFQFAFIYSLARKHNCNFTIIELDKYTNPHSNNHYNFLKNSIKSLPNYSLSFNTKPIHIDEICEFKYNDYNCTTNFDFKFRGYFQTEKYFKMYRNDILKILKEPKYISDKLNSCDIDFENGMFLHLRLGDYTDLGLVIPINYYKKCLELIPQHISKIYVFSNDLDRAKEELDDVFDKNFYYVKFNEIETLYSMARMKYGGICGNSSFSWWGLWLNQSPNKLVFMPKPWLKDIQSIDIYPEYTTIIQY